MAVALVTIVVIAALLVIACGVWVLMGLFAALGPPKTEPAASRGRSDTEITGNHGP